MKKMPICIGAGLVALDVILNGSPLTLPKLSAGGSCGNVLSILGYLGWSSYPVARLANDQASHELINDLNRWHINTDHLSVSDTGSTPIIIHRILKDKDGMPIHRFEFRDPETKSWLPQFKAITKHVASEVIQKNLVPQLFYFDRMNPGTLELATYLKTKGTIIFFEPSSIKDEKQFNKFLAITDILKFSQDRLPEYKSQFPEPKCFLEIETLGKDGLNFRTISDITSNRWQNIPGFSLDKVQDAAGAGDWCSSGIINLLCSGGYSSLLTKTNTDIKGALLYGQALGALNCLYDGARGLMYHYGPDELFEIVSKFINFKSVSRLHLSTSPRIDISSMLKFSDLYKTV